MMKTSTIDPRVEEAQKVLQDGIAALVAGADWKKYLEFQAKFHNYSLCNTFWLMAQAMRRGIEISQFAGFNTWRDAKRQVRKGEKAFQVLAPLRYKREVVKDGTKENVFGIRGFRVASTFDISQTDGPALPEIVSQLQGTSEEIEAVYASLVKFSTEINKVPVRREVLPAGTNGYYSREGFIVVSSTISGLQALKTLAHEIAHSILHEKLADCHDQVYREVEAESTAFVVLHSLGFSAESYSFGYVAGWSKGDAKIVKEVAERVQRAAKTILGSLVKPKTWQEHLDDDILEDKAA
jgi:antirestriction protein ArdC